VAEVVLDCPRIDAVVGGISDINFVRGQQRLAIIDKPLQG